MSKLSLLIMLASLSLVVESAAQTVATDSVMMTIFLKHQQDKTLDSINHNLDKSGFRDMFPPKTARVISWYVMMGIGQVVTLKFPASELRAVNLSIEKGAWSAFNTEFYPTYDYVPIWQESLKRRE